MQTAFRYWAASRTPELSETSVLFMGPHPDVHSYTADVHDIRTSSERFNLADHGFQILKHDSAFVPLANSKLDFNDPEQVKLKYWPELSGMAREQLKSQLVLPINSAVRETSGSNKPINFVHNDISPIGARNYLRAIRPTFFEDTGCSDNIGIADQELFFKLRHKILEMEGQAMDEAGCTDHTGWDGANYGGPRWALFSIWRPLETVRQDPLGVTDSSSVFAVPGNYSEKHAAYVSIDFPVQGEKGLDDYKAGNIIPIMPSSTEKHKWYWMSDQQPNEIYAIKLFDSEAWKACSNVVPCCAHSAFTIPSTQDLPPRKSIETRCFVMW